MNGISLESNFRKQQLRVKKPTSSMHRNTHGTQFTDVYQIKDLMNDNQISISGLLQLILEVNLRNKMKRNYKK